MPVPHLHPRGRRPCSYGFVTNTQIKFVLAVDGTALKEPEVRGVGPFHSLLSRPVWGWHQLAAAQMFRQLHDAYLKLVCNPFFVPDAPITSKCAVLGAMWLYFVVLG